MTQEWISVKDRLPEGECLCVGYQSEMIIGYLGLETSGFIAENESTILKYVTHWQPLPQPPKEEQG